MTQNAGKNQGGISKTSNKSADKRRRKEHETGTGQTEAKPRDPGTGTDGRAPSGMTGGRR
jgi:hypothetical protein